MPENKYVLKNFGPITKRRDYSNTFSTLETPDLLSIQLESYKKFIESGIEESIEQVYPIVSTSGTIEVNYVKNSIRLEKTYGEKNLKRRKDWSKTEFEAVKKSKQKGITLAAKLYVKLRIINKETGEIKEDEEVLFGEIPVMTKGGTFIINGAEKVIISQLVRSAGVFLGKDVRHGSSDQLFNKLEVIPSFGSWLEVLHNVTYKDPQPIRISIDKGKLTLVSELLRAMGMQKETIKTLFGETPQLLATLAKDKLISEDDALEQLHLKIRKGDRVTEDSKRNLLSNMFFNRKRYNLSETGRHMLNRKLNIMDRIEDTYLAENLTNNKGEVLFKKGQLIDKDMSEKIQKSFENKILPLINIPDLNAELFGAQIETFPKLVDTLKIILVKVYPSLVSKENDDFIHVIGNNPFAEELHLLPSDMIASIGYHINIIQGTGEVDDLDSLTNKRIITVGELLKSQFRTGLSKLEKNVKERMSSKEVDKISPKNITHNKPIFNQFKSFFNSSQLSQFMDQINPLAEIANKRRITSLGPGGLNRDTASFDVRDVHSTHYGRICPIESPEGPNIGLILNFAVYSRVNKLGFIETPYFPVTGGQIDLKPVYLSAIEEIGKTFAQSGTLVVDGKISGSQIPVRKDREYIYVKNTEIDYLAVSPRQITSISASCIPFLESDDANRTLMGSNMQRQAVPLLKSEAPLVATGIESEIAKYSAQNVRSEVDGVVVYVDSEKIEVKDKEGKKHAYYLRSYERTNQGSQITQKPLVKLNQKVKVNELLVDGSSFDNGEMAIGKNVVVAFTTWNGYNYEDAVIMSERLVTDDVYTSIHIENYSVQLRTSKAGNDELTLDLPNVSNHSKRFLDETGVVAIGSDVTSGDILVGRTSPKGEDNPTPEEKLIAAIFSQKVSKQKDTSLKVKHGQGGTVIDVQILSRENGDKLEDGVEKIVKVYIAQKRKIKVGDKMAGRHGNKGVISRILPIEDMPHLADGTPVDIMLNPLGVPSRMNIGQILEIHLGMAARTLGVKFVSPTFDGIKYEDINAALEEGGLPSNGKFELYDPTSGQTFDNPVSVGVMYMIKLAHMVDDKMHGRSVGPYSLITQQPLGGKAQNGGQRFGEMETWAVESYGASNILQEILTYKSDNIDGRNKVYNALATGKPIPEPGTPESFNVLGYELRGLGMKMTVEIDKKEQEKELAQEKELFELGGNNE